MDRKIGTLNIRELTGFFLLTLLLLAGLISSWYMGRQHTAMAGQLEDCAWLALSGQWENARTAADEVKKHWEQNWSLRAALADQTPMEEIDALFAELTIYGAAGERTDFADTCAALASRVDAIGNAHRLSLWNIF